LPSSIAERIPSFENEMLYEPSSTMVSFTRSIICSKISSAPSFLNSSESYASIRRHLLTKYIDEFYMEIDLKKIIVPPQPPTKMGQIIPSSRQD
jgi:hypothetical protein